MSRMLPPLSATILGIVAILWPVAPAAAQEAYGPFPESEGDGEAAAPLTESEQCATESREDGVILVCRELEDGERYRTPLPAPVASDRRIISGLTDPPCWVTNPEAVGTAACMRIGWAPEPALMIDVTEFPEPLSNEDAAKVSAIEQASDDRPAIGERVPIDLSED